MMRLTPIVLSVLAVTMLSGPASGQQDSYRAENEIRMMEMENQLRRVTGQYEEAMYRLMQLNRRMERTLEDVEYRLGELEKRSSTVEGAEAGSAGFAAQPQDADSTSDVMSSVPEDQAVVADPNETLDITSNEPAPAVAASPTPETAPEQFLTTGTPDAQFNAAFAQLRRNELESAEMAFRAFLVLHADHALASNAKYWLGKTYYARGNYTEAARVFLEGFEKFADTDKGPDTLLHLALSLDRIGQQEDACAAFGEIGVRYPELDASIAQRVSAGQQAAGCL